MRRGRRREGESADRQNVAEEVKEPRSASSATFRMSWTALILSPEEGVKKFILGYCELGLPIRWTSPKLFPSQIKRHLSETTVATKMTPQL